jgi:lipopolysaccharide transport system ATP-binding protein
MSDTVIKVENLSKLYRIGAKEGYKTFRETLIDSAKAPFLLCRDLARKTIRPLRHAPGSMRSSQSDEYIWALKDVSFEVKQGEVVGIIGRNGAGKSTLLKILSKITEPTEGRVELRGRVGSLLEVGTGFHPELTGHENVYLYGAILGMDRWEVTRKFDQIIAFAELEKFVDTPVKRYSSGMYMRLAFAVAAHLEPEILLIDEVLAVGDAAFQKKCLGKMDDVSKEGRTVLFVSHNMSAIQSLCQESILLDKGKISGCGPTNVIVGQYMSSASPTSEAQAPSKNVRSIRRAKGSGIVKLTAISLKKLTGELANSFSVWEPFIVDLEFLSEDILITASFWILVYTSFGTIILSSFQYDSLEPVRLIHKQGIARVYIDPNSLTPGHYSLSAGVFGKNNEFYDWVEQVMTFDIQREFSTGQNFDERLGQTTLRYRWEVL